MTVQELIDELKRFDQHTEVRYDGNGIEYVTLSMTTPGHPRRIVQLLPDVPRNYYMRFKEACCSDA